MTSVAVLCFLLVLSEFLPIGLLPQISAGVGISTGTAGLMIVTPGLIAAVTAPLVTIAAGRRDRRHVLIILSGLLAASNALVAVAPNLEVLLFARILLGVAVGGFWALGIGIAVRLVPADTVDRASSVITAGISAATVISLPLGALIGHLVGWRVGFLGAALAALLALVSLVALLPALPPSASVGMAALTAAARRSGVRRVALATVLVFLGHFASYTYITPFLQETRTSDTRRSP
ncbi:MFS transporter [Micromonospora sp. CPCC 205556]|uniref:MFS transporter n=1 Tax=Micromonospora sp. CPCC 205556 TaxID=3122398 RepID=UPI002FF3F593